MVRELNEAIEALPTDVLAVRQSSWMKPIPFKRPKRLVKRHLWGHGLSVAVTVGALWVVPGPWVGQVLQHPVSSSLITRLVRFSQPDPARMSLTRSSKESEIAQNTEVRHYEYVFPDGNVYVYDLDSAFKLVKRISVPTSAGVRGSVASAVTGILYLSYGSDRSAVGSLLAYDLRTDTVLWQHHYPIGIDSMSITADGSKIYMPTGELAPGGIWEVLNARNGSVIGSIDTKGKGPHNTVLSPNDSHVYMGLRASNYLIVANTVSNTVIKKIGPVVGGIRPFTINGKETLTFITTSGFLGFQVGDIRTGEIIYKVPVQGFPSTGGAASAPSHGISLSPDEKEIYLIDSINSYVHVFDVSGLPASGPRQVADIQLVGALTGNESDCAYDCLKDGWIHHSRDARYVFVGDSGDVIDTVRRVTVAFLPAMANTRKEIEIDFQKGAPVWAMNNRSSVGAWHPH